MVVRSRGGLSHADILVDHHIKPRAVRADGVFDALGALDALAAIATVMTHRLGG